MIPKTKNLVVLDMLIEKMDVAFEKDGFEPSDLRLRLREYNENPCKKKRRMKLVDEDKTIEELTLQNFNPKKSIFEVRTTMGEREKQLIEDIKNDEAWLEEECESISRRYE